MKEESMDDKNESKKERGRIDLNRALECNDEVGELIHDMFLYHAWDETQTLRGVAVRRALEQAVKVIVASVPPSPDRSAAIRKIREALMDCNSAITHGGKY